MNSFSTGPRIGAPCGPFAIGGVKISGFAPGGWGATSQVQAENSSVKPWRIRKPSPPSAAVVGSLLAGLRPRSEEHTSELQSRLHLVCRLLLEKKKFVKELFVAREVATP